MKIRSMLTLLILMRAAKLFQIALLIAGVFLAIFFIAYPTFICGLFNHLPISGDDCQALFWKTQIAIASAFYLVAILLVLPNLFRRLSESEISKFKSTPFDLYNDLIFKTGLVGTTYSLKQVEPVTPHFASKNLYGADVYLRHSHLTNKKYVLMFILMVVLIQVMVTSDQYSTKGILIKFIAIHCVGFFFYEATLFLLALLVTLKRKNENE